VSRIDAIRRAVRLPTSRGFWRSVRPRTRRGAALAAVGIVGAAAVLAVVFFAGAIVAWSPYVESVVRPATDARAWAALEPRYGDAAMCRRCHEQESAKAAAGLHAGIGCESCHGALVEHALAGPGTPDAAVALAVPTDELCVRCHVSAVGRPATLRQVVPAEHYVSACLQCHDPHTGISRRPLVVLHPLVDLPPCVTCHGPEGFKARNQRHPAVSGNEPCLACHAPGRGPEDE
jgi:hypothetical protein